MSFNFHHMIQIVMQWFALLASFVAIFVFNYKLSEWLFIINGKHFFQYILMLALSITVISLALYVFCMLLKKSYARPLFNITVLRKNVKGLESLSFAMSGLKEIEYSNRNIMTSCRHKGICNPCLICYEYVATTTIEPCQHQAMCARCAWKYVAKCLKDHRPFTCIICRTVIKSFKGDTTVVLNSKDVKEVMTRVSQQFSEEKEYESEENEIPCSS